MRGSKVLYIPVGEDEIRALKLGEAFFITGTIFTARDLASARLLHNDGQEGLEIRGSAIYHCGPIVRNKRGAWEVIAAGPTTSMRMEPTMAELIEKLGIRLIIGKGGMGPRTLKALQRFGAVYAAFTGGAAQVAAEAIKGVKGVYYLEELGPVEAMWALNVERFGPLIVAMDAHGHSLYERVQTSAMEKLERGKAHT